MKKRAFIFDGNSFCYRAFYAIKHLSNSKGEPTNAIYGFLTMLRRILDVEKPEYCAVCFDRKEKTFRKEKYADYKAHRKPMPDDLVVQIPKIKELVSALNIPIFELPGFEADDLLGTLAKSISEQGVEVFIATSDKDALQLVNESVFIYSSQKDKVKIYDIDGVKERYNGLSPEQVTDIMGLMGDSSDNIPGVPGIGEKTAVSLISEFGSIKALYENIDSLKKSARKVSLIENEELAYLSKELATIDQNVDIKIDLDSLVSGEANFDKLTILLKDLGFKKILKEITHNIATETEEKRQYHLIDTKEKMTSFVDKLGKVKIFAFDTETTSVMPFLAELIGFSFSFKEYEAFYVPLKHEKIDTIGGVELDYALDLLKPFLADSAYKKYGQNIKYDAEVLLKYGIMLKGVYFDTMVAAYLINPMKWNQNLDDIAFDYLSVKKIAYSSLVGSGKSKKRLDQIPLEAVCEYACEDADCVFRLVPILLKELEAKGATELFFDLEMPLVSVLMKMESNGVCLDKEHLKALSENANQELSRLQNLIFEEAGEEFNINSPKQLAAILFDKLKLKGIKKTKTGYSTDVSVLERLSEDADIAKYLLEFREYSKLKSTYLDALPDLINANTGFVHTSFNQTVTATGRLSSSSPNMQNIPIKTKLGREVRKAFVPRQENRLILSADYSQIELRLLAHFSQDSDLLDAFSNGKDIHLHTATLLYDVGPEQVTYEMRNLAKVVNFSIIYGKTSFGLSKELSITVQEAKNFIDEYFLRYSNIATYLESVKDFARENGFVETILGRRVYVPEINSSNGMRRQFAERAATNAPLQGSAADLIKKAMIDVQSEMNKKSLDALMLIQVHDELVFDVSKKDIDGLKILVSEKMENAMKLSVPLKVDVSIGDSWYK